MKKNIEYENMVRMYENNKGVHKYMDLVTFAWNFYQRQIDIFQERQKFWTLDNVKQFLNPSEKKKKKVIVRVKAKK